jgi:hypothetical protein
VILSLIFSSFFLAIAVAFVYFTLRSRPVPPMPAEAFSQQITVRERIR